LSNVPVVGKRYENHTGRTNTESAKNSDFLSVIDGGTDETAEF